MKRNVFIIASPLQYSPETWDFQSGVQTDKGNYRSYFESPTGGAFQNIYSFTNPSFDIISRTFRENPSDYAVVVYTGHGYHGKDSNKTILDINSREQISVSNLILQIKAPRILLLIDACRNIKKEEREFLGADGIPLMDFTSNLTHSQARNIFDNYLRKCPGGVQIIYSSSPDEYSGITQLGSIFTTSILTSVNDWASEKENNSILLVKGAHDFSKRSIQSSEIKDQNPVIIASDDSVNYPFAVRRGSELVINQQKEFDIEAWVRG